jgi:hypothetical protein
MTDEYIPDEVDIALERMITGQRLLDLIRVGEQLFDIEEALVERVADAIQEQDFAATVEAVNECVRAAMESRGIL